MTNAMRTARPKPVSWSGPTSYERGSCTMEAKISCIGLNLGCDQSRDRAARVGVEIESSALALLEAKESGAGDHRCVVGGQTRSWREDGDAFRFELLSHRHRESRVAGNAAAEDQTLPRKLENTTRCFLDQS